MQSSALSCKPILASGVDVVLITCILPSTDSREDLFDKVISYLDSLATNIVSVISSSEKVVTVTIETAMSSESVQTLLERNCESFTGFSFSVAGGARHTRTAQCNLTDRIVIPNLSDQYLTRDELLRGMSDREFVPFSQAIYDLKGQAPIGVELLCRWEHSRLGLLQPYQFLGAISHFGLGVELDFYMLTQACEILERWTIDNANKLSVSVNVHAESLSGELFYDFIARIQDEWKFDLSRLRLEITETGIIKNNSPAHKNIVKLQNLGMTISLDDFGSGTTILGYLTYLCPNEIKIDRSLINSAFYADDPEKKLVATKMLLSMVDWVNAMAGVQLVVEGIENQEQMDFLTKNSVSIGQGYLFGRPTPLRNFEAQMMGV